MAQRYSISRCESRERIIASHSYICQSAAAAGLKEKSMNRLIARLLVVATLFVAVAPGLVAAQELSEPGKT